MVHQVEGQDCRVSRIPSHPLDSPRIGAYSSLKVQLGTSCPTRLSQILLDSACVLADLGYTVLSDTCTPVEGDEAPLWLNILAHVSLAITTLFLVEIPVTVWALGFQFFNPVGEVTHATLHLFDAVVILTTFVLEIVLRGKERELASLLIVLRLWRLVKLVGGPFLYATTYLDRVDAN